MNERIRKNTVASCWIIFAILIFVHGFEAIVLRMDETFLGENFINKVFGILVIFLVLRSLNWKWSEIGFAKKYFGKNICLGFLIAMCSFIVSYSVEIIILKSQGHDISFGIFTTGFSLTGETAVHTGIGFILLCIFFNLINVIMEEGTFRGLFSHISLIDHSSKYALFFQAFLFGLWHLITPFRSFLDGDMNLLSFIVMSVGYVMLSAIMGIKWGLLYKMTGSIWMGLADHFFNNCVVTNLLHVVTSSGVDEMQIARVLIGELTSFVAVLIYMKFKNINIKSLEAK